jgi:hypothetical protein
VTFKGNQDSYRVVETMMMNELSVIVVHVAEFLLVTVDTTQLHSTIILSSAE